MVTRISKRVYTDASLEFWFLKLASDWEHQFGEGVLSEGRRYYRNGYIKAVELGDKDAIVHGQWEDFEGYVVLDWSDDKLHIRSSMAGQHLLERSLAVAGLYEVEELVGDEVLAVTPEIAETTVPTAETDAANTGLAGSGTNGTALSESSESQAENIAVRALLLRFNLEETGLGFEVFWETVEGKLVPALGEHAAPADEITTKERELLIRLASLARRAGFRFRMRKSGYILEELERAPAFVRNDLSLWKKHFSIEADAEIEALKHGIYDVEVIAQAEVEDERNLELHWEMYVGNEMLNDAESRWLIRQGPVTSVLPGRGLVRVSTQDSEALQDWEDAVGSKPNGSVPKYMLFSIFDYDGLKLRMTDELRTWQKSLFKPKAMGAAFAKKFAYLRPYQSKGVHWLTHLCQSDCHGLLADEMGLGKTLQVLSLLVSKPVEGLPSLIVCPASVVPVWLGEIERFFPELAVKVVKKGNHFGQEQEPVLWICSYTQLRRHKAELDSASFGYTVLDEAQYIKNPEAKVTIACMHIKARHRLALTGTPLENRFLDVWTLFRFLMPGLLGRRKKFEQDLAADPFGTIARVRKQIAPFILRRTKKDVAKDLPAKVESDLICPLTDYQRAEYTRLANEGVAKLGDAMDSVADAGQAMSFFTLLTRLRQCCCDPDLLPWTNSDLQHSGKLNVLVERLSEVIANKHKVVIFSQFVSLLNRAELALQQNFPDLPLFRLTGKTRDRAKPVNEFQAQDGSAVFLVSLKAGGTGITLHSADYVFLLDPWWNPAVEQQAIDRVHRIGQKKNVFVYRMITSGTLEMKIQKLKEEKKHLFDEAIGELSDNSDFKQYFSSLSDLIALIPG